ncbi:hypothetical protein ZWY2020_014835 [Hordeum vulgare]|nr:hypothetical protein ZWY2020_014835 [Hordeum vulgare]
MPLQPPPRPSAPTTTSPAGPSPLASALAPITQRSSRPVARASLPVPSTSSPVIPDAIVWLTLAKVKEGVEVGQLVEKVATATRDAGEASDAKVSFGENFSPSRAKGYQFGMVTVFNSVEELDDMEGDGKVEEAKAALRPMLDEVIVLDFVDDDLATASL